MRARPAWLRATWIGLGMALGLAPFGAGAHQRSMSFSNWSFDEQGARLHLRVSELDLSRLGLAYAAPAVEGDPVADYLLAHLRLGVDGQPCASATAPQRRATEPGWQLLIIRWTCPPGRQRSITSDLFFAVAPSHLHFAHVTGAQSAERILSYDARNWTLPLARGAQSGTDRAAAQPASSRLRDYVELGVRHILSGADHLAFLLALLLLASALGEVLWLVSAFTLAHSLTLAASALGWLRVPAAPVEALIGFSIALVATENLWLLSAHRRSLPIAFAAGLAALAWLPSTALGPLALCGLALFSLCHFGLLARSARPARLRALLAFVFGLVHGFGFAGVLEEMALPLERRVLALFGFNSGVEIGQLLLVAASWPLLRALERTPAAAWLREGLSAAVAGLGIYWLVTRALS